jgi:hypothetical protein
MSEVSSRSKAGIEVNDLSRSEFSGEGRGDVMGEVRCEVRGG